MQWSLSIVVTVEGSHLSVVVIPVNGGQKVLHVVP